MVYVSVSKMVVRGVCEGSVYRDGELMMLLYFFFFQAEDGIRDRFT